MAHKPPSFTETSHIRCVIFDLDGTLIDSVPAYFQLMEMILETIGLPPAPKSVVSEFMIGGGLKVIENHIPQELAHRKAYFLDEFLKVAKRISRTVLKDRVRVFDGVHRLFARLSALDIPMGIVTSTERAYLDRKLKPLEKDGIKGYLNAVIGIEDAPRKKPFPDPLIVCSEQLGVDARDCVYVGDSHVDIRAANAAKMMSVAVLSGLDDHETLMAENPRLILQTVKELLKVF